MGVVAVDELELQSAIDVNLAGQWNPSPEVADGGDAAADEEGAEEAVAVGGAVIAFDDEGVVGVFDDGQDLLIHGEVAGDAVALVWGWRGWTGGH